MKWWKYQTLWSIILEEWKERIPRRKAIFKNSKIKKIRLCITGECCLSSNIDFFQKTEQVNLCKAQSSGLLPRAHSCCSERCRGPTCGSPETLEGLKREIRFPVNILDYLRCPGSYRKGEMGRILWIPDYMERILWDLQTFHEPQ